MSISIGVPKSFIGQTLSYLSQTALGDRNVPMAIARLAVSAIAIPIISFIGTFYHLFMAVAHAVWGGAKGRAIQHLGSSGADFLRMLTLPSLLVFTFNPKVYLKNGAKERVYPKLAEAAAIPFAMILIYNILKAFSGVEYRPEGLSFWEGIKKASAKAKAAERLENARLTHPEKRVSDETIPARQEFEVIPAVETTAFNDQAVKKIAVEMIRDLNVPTQKAAKQNGAQISYSRLPAHPEDHIKLALLRQQSWPKILSSTIAA